MKLTLSEWCIAIMLAITAVFFIGSFSVVYYDYLIATVGKVISIFNL